MDLYPNYISIGIKLINDRDTSIKNYVAIFDIDDTILDRNGNIIESVFRLYKYALNNNIYIVFITARDGSSENKKITIEQLKHNNIKYDLLYFLPPYMKKDKNVNREIVEKYKFYARKNVNECGYKALFSVGDMYWDVCSRWEKDNEYSGIPILLK